MRSHIVTLTSIVCFTAASTTAMAQEVLETKKKEAGPKLVVGASLGLSSAFLSPTIASDQYFKGSGGLFARYHFGKHLAVEAGFNYGLEVSKTKDVTYILGNNTYSTDMATRFNTYSVPVQLQYHLLSPESKIRPYFGIGGGITRSDFFTKAFRPSEGFGDYRVSRTFAFASFTQGVTWQINKRWQISKSLNVIQDLQQGGRPTLDFRVGVGYRLFNK